MITTSSPATDEGSGTEAGETSDGMPPGDPGSGVGGVRLSGSDMYVGTDIGVVTVTAEGFPTGCPLRSRLSSTRRATADGSDDPPDAGELAPSEAIPSGTASKVVELCNLDKRVDIFMCLKKSQKSHIHTKLCVCFKTGQSI